MTPVQYHRSLRLKHAASLLHSSDASLPNDLGSVSNSDLTGFGYFIAKILGDPLGAKYSIDIYQALDMALPGLLGYRSILDKGMPYTVPDLRDHTIRDQYRNDHYCTDPFIG